MEITSVSAVRAMASGGLDAMDDAAEKYSRGLGARATDPADTQRRAGSPTGTRSGQKAANGRETLPEGFVPLRDVKDMALLGWWPVLDDRMSPCFPARILAAMQRRESLGDHDATAWLRMHAQACSGDPEAQRTFGRMCENGSHRVSADLQRAFFWYFRAGLQGDGEARRNAERLMHRSARICPATMAEPQLIYPGQWRITAHLSDHLHSASLFDLASDGSAAGSLLGNSRATLGAPADVARGAGDFGGDALSASPPEHDFCYRGGWAFDGIGQVLTIIFESEGGERRWRNANWQIELLGCKTGAIFGRDRRMVGYTLEHLPEGGGE